MTVRFHAGEPGGGDGDPRAAARAQAGRAVAGGVAEALAAAGPAVGAREALLGGALAVTTGQQAGLFTGPLYAVLKALSAAALARALADELGRPVVPVFWVAGDDHDFAEINHVTVIGADGAPAGVVLRERAEDAPMLPAFREPVGAEGAAALARLEAALPQGPSRTWTLEWLTRAYTPDRSLAEAYTHAMAELLAPYGVVVARGWHGDLKRAARAVLLGAARQAGSLDAKLAEGAARLAATGARVPVETGRGLTLLMLEAHAGRDRLRLADGGGFTARRGGETLSLDDLAAIMDRTPERLSANVLLRPVVEASVFPTVAYLGGPGELSYLAQTAPLYDTLGVPRQAFLPRLSGAFVEAKVDRVLAKYRLTPGDLERPSRELTARVARDDFPDGAAAALERLREAVAGEYAALAAAAAAVDPTLERAAEGARNRALAGSRRIEQKLVRALRRRADTALHQLNGARTQLFPLGVPQERVLTAASVLARHGPGALDLAFAAARTHAAALLVARPAAS